VNANITRQGLIVENAFRSTMTNRGTELQQLMHTNANLVIAMVYLSGVILMRTCIVRLVTEVTVLIVKTTLLVQTASDVVTIISVVAALIAASHATAILLAQATPNATIMEYVNANLECQGTSVIVVS
jgi:hypothetical protein